MIVFLAGLALLSFTSPSAAKVAVTDTTWTTWPNTVYYFFGRTKAAGTNYKLGPNAPYTDPKIHITAVDRYTLYVNGKLIGSDDKWQTVETWTIPGSVSDLFIAVKVDNFGLGNGNGLMVDIEAGPDRIGTSTMKRKAAQVLSAGTTTMVEYPVRWYYYSGDIVNLFNTNYKRTDWFTFDNTLFDDAAKLGFKWVMLGNMGDINYLPDNSEEIVTGYNGNVDSATPKNGGIQLRRIDGEDIALLKPAQEERLTDGDLTQGFQYVMDPLTTHKQVDLVQLYRINKLVLYTGGPNPNNWVNDSTRGFSAQISLDNFRYAEVGVIHDVGITNRDNGGYNYAEVSFPAQMTRYIQYYITESRLLPPNIGEMMVYGTGYAYNGVYESDIISFGSPLTQKNISSISWTGDMPSGTSIAIQTATRYRLADGTPTAFSNWSPFHYETNYKFDSPEPATEFKYRLTLSTGNVDRTPVFKSLKVVYSQTDQPFVNAKSSISPNAVPMGADTSFVYKLAYSLAPGTPVEDIKNVVISVPNFAKVDSVFSTETKKLLPFTYTSTNDSLYVTLTTPLVNTDAKSPDSLRVYLRTSILKSLHEFRSFVYNSRGNDAAGGINVGENTDESWTVKTNTVLQEMVTDVKALPKAFTPNGDGVNDFTVLEFTLTKVDNPTPLLIKIYSTDGTLIRELYNNRLSARDYRIPNGPSGLKAGSAADAKKLPGYWDGKKQDGKLVPPGVYIYQIIAKTDEGDKSKTGTVAVAY
jgi:hypothetical protein